MCLNIKPQAGHSVLWRDVLSLRSGVVVLWSGVVVVVLVGLDAPVGEEKWSGGGMGCSEREAACFLYGSIPTCAELRCRRHGTAAEKRRTRGRKKVFYQDHVVSY